MTLSDKDSDETWQTHRQNAGGIASMKTGVWFRKPWQRQPQCIKSTCGFNTRMFHCCACHFVYCKWLNRASEKTKAILLEQTVSCSLLMYSETLYNTLHLPDCLAPTHAQRILCSLLRELYMTVQDLEEYMQTSTQIKQKQAHKYHPIYQHYQRGSSTSGFAYILRTKSPH